MKPKYKIGHYIKVVDICYPINTVSIPLKKYGIKIGDIGKIIKIYNRDTFQYRVKFLNFDEIYKRKGKLREDFTKATISLDKKEMEIYKGEKILLYEL